MLRWRTDKKAEEADTIETVRALLSDGNGKERGRDEDKRER
jgi:hypothetical protein